MVGAVPGGKERALAAALGFIVFVAALLLPDVPVLVRLGAFVVCGAGLLIGRVFEYRSYRVHFKRWQNDPTNHREFIDVKLHERAGLVFLVLLLPIIGIAVAVAVAITR